jgi:hypothetical protein
MLEHLLIQLMAVERLSRFLARLHRGGELLRVRRGRLLGTEAEKTR